MKYTTWLVALATGLVASGAAADDVANKDQASSDRRDHLRVGAIGGVGFPHPFAVEALVKIERVVALGAEYGFSPDITVSGVTASMWSAAGDVRVFPLRGAFFIGARVGLQHLGASSAEYAQAVAVDTFFVNPRIGFLWTWKSGFSLGIDAGVQLPLSHSVTGTSTAMSIPQLTNVANTIGGTVLPTIDLLKLGFLL